MKKIKLKEDVNGLTLSMGDMKRIVGGTIYSGHYCNCLLSLNAKTEDGYYEVIDISNSMPNVSTKSFETCSAACLSACISYSSGSSGSSLCILSSPGWGECTD